MKQVGFLLKPDDDEVLVFNPKVTLKVNHYQGKYIELWLKQHGKDEVIVKSSETGLWKSFGRCI